ncbi:hypothetical protein B0H19DRAFT_1166084 [Mycena capillaripes]|nr:hypothetical protein B0H19DRAFT_1166084 [Mycena capillaripes]
MSSRSRAGGGLPSGPGPRARSVTRTRDADRGRYDSDGDGDERASPRPSTRQVRPQKSMTSMNQSRSNSQAPPMPSSRPRRNPNPSYDSRDSATNRSSDSTTSSASSFFDRMKQTAGYASSRTSLEDDEPDKRPSRSTRNRPARGDSPPPDENDTPGDTLWSKIASTASSLTVNVGKSWATNITTFAGEETPVGQESRLTRAMKAYHLEKARDPSDLPAWLFDEKERRPAPAPAPSRSKRRDDDYDDYEVVEKTRAEPPASRGLRDIYEAAAASASASSTPSSRSTRGARSYADDTPQPSKATDRLKALRDAKRGAVNAGRDEERAPRAAEPEPEAPPPARRRVGLPSGPVRRI